MKIINEQPHLLKNKKVHYFFDSLPGFDIKDLKSTILSELDEDIQNMDYSIKEQFGFLSMQYTSVFSEINDVFNEALSCKTSKNNIIEILSTPINYSIFMSSFYFNKDSIFEKYINGLSNNISLLNPKLNLILIDEINNYKKI